MNTTTRGMWFVQLLDDLGKAFGLPNGTRDMTVENYGKLILKESDTTVGVFNPFGFREDYGGQDMIPMDYQVKVRESWPKSTVMLAGGLTPNQGLSETLDRLNMYVDKYKISGLKLYTFDSTKKKGWWFDDEKLAYPIWEAVPQARHQEHRLPQGHSVRPVLRPLCARGGFRRDGGRLPGSELHRLPLGLAVSRRAGRVEGLQAAAQEPVLRSRLHLRRDRHQPSDGVRARARHAAARPRARLRACGAPTRCCGATRSGRSTRSASSRSPISWSRGTAIPRSRRRFAARSSARMRRASGTSTSRPRCRPRPRSSATRLA